MTKGWDKTAIKKLQALIGRGLSTAEIGKRLGMSKNAVVGKLNRMGWNAKSGEMAAPKPKAKKTLVIQASGKKTKTAKKETSSKSSATKNAKAGSATTKSKVKSLPRATSGKCKESVKSQAVHERIIKHALEMVALKPNQCRWPVGDPDSENFHFCGEPVFVGKPYCYEHCKQAYQFLPPKKK